MFFCMCERKCGRGHVTLSLCATATQPRWRRSFRGLPPPCWRSSSSLRRTSWFVAVCSTSPSPRGSDFLSVVLDVLWCVCVHQQRAWWVICRHSGLFVQPRVLHVLQVIWRTSASLCLMIYFALAVFFLKLFCDWTVVSASSALWALKCHFLVQTFIYFSTWKVKMSLFVWYKSWLLLSDGFGIFLAC